MNFHARAPGNYVVLTGNANVAAPDYDVAQFVAGWRSLPGNSVAFSPAELNPNYQRPRLLPETPLLGTAVDVSKWKFRKAVLSPAPGVQELELDQEVLASTNRGLSDLKLVQDNRQVPYIIERSSLSRLLRLTPTEDHDPKIPRISRWKLALPVPALPLQRLTVASPTALFNRTLQLFEFTIDGRGERSRRNLSGAETWYRTSDDRAELTLQLKASPIGHELYWETDNGDNASLQAGNAVAEYPVIRLLFGADTNPLHLYYGAEDVSAPRYDLALVSPRLLNEEKQTATLGPAEVLHPRGRGVSLFSGPSGGIILWTSLAVVVGALLFAIAKLLPKQSDSDPT